MESTNTEVIVGKEEAQRPIKLFPTKEDYVAMKKAWAINQPNYHTDKIVMYNLLRGMNPRRGFTPATRKSRLDNGYLPDYAYREAVRSLKKTVEMWNKYPTHVEWFSQLTYSEHKKQYIRSAFGATVTDEILNEALKGLENE